MSAVLALAGVLGFIRVEPQRAIPPARRSAPGRPDPLPARPLRLDLGSGQGRDETGVPFLRLGSDAERTEVSFVPRGASPAETVRIEDEAGRTVVAPISLPHPDARGRATMSVPAAALRRSGRYVLVLTRDGLAGLGLHRGPTSVEDRYPFLIETEFGAAAAR